MTSIYTSGEYLASNRTWHVEDSAWKAAKITALLRRNGINPRTVAEIGCGAGSILFELSNIGGFAEDVEFRGYDISPHAIELAQEKRSERLEFFNEDMFSSLPAVTPDVLLAIDVFEHVPDYLGFISNCRFAAKIKIYHIPLDIHVSSVLRDSFDDTRRNLGHIHSFTASTAIAALQDTGHSILDAEYTNGAIGLFRQHPSLKRAVANIPRWSLSKLSVPLAARLFGGYSLLVLAK